MENNLKELRIFVEGDEDKIFFETESLIYKMIRSKYSKHKVITYSGTKVTKEVIAVVKGFDTNKIDYIVLADSDYDGKAICPLSKKTEFLRIDESKILIHENVWIVQEEIESWYYACSNFDKPNNYNTITKSDFQNQIKKNNGGKTPISRAYHNILKNIVVQFEINKSSRNKSLERFLLHFGFISNPERKLWEKADSMLKAGFSIEHIINETNLTEREISEMNNKK